MKNNNYLKSMCFIYLQTFLFCFVLNFICFTVCYSYIRCVWGDSYCGTTCFEAIFCPQSFSGEKKNEIQTPNILLIKKSNRIGNHVFNFQKYYHCERRWKKKKKNQTLPTNGHTPLYTYVYISCVYIMCLVMFCSENSSLFEVGWSKMFVQY